MSGSQTSHITVAYKSNGAEITGTYAVNEDVSRELEQKGVWLGFRLFEKPTGKKLERWLESKGCQLDSSNGPAYAWYDTDGSMAEIYFQNGTLHREGGPAIFKRDDDGVTRAEYYRNGKKDREDGPADIRRSADGSTVIEAYYRDDTFIREEILHPFETPRRSVRQSQGRVWFIHQA